MAYPGYGFLENRLNQVISQQQADRNRIAAAQEAQIQQDFIAHQNALNRRQNNLQFAIGTGLQVAGMGLNQFNVNRAYNAGVQQFNRQFDRQSQQYDRSFKEGQRQFDESMKQRGIEFTEQSGRARGLDLMSNAADIANMAAAGVGIGSKYAGKTGGTTTSGANYYAAQPETQQEQATSAAGIRLLSAAGDAIVQGNAKKTNAEYQQAEATDQQQAMEDAANGEADTRRQVLNLAMQGNPFAINTARNNGWYGYSDAGQKAVDSIDAQIAQAYDPSGPIATTVPPLYRDMYVAKLHAAKAMIPEGPRTLPPTKEELSNSQKVFRTNPNNGQKYMEVLNPKTGAWEPQLFPGDKEAIEHANNLELEEVKGRIKINTDRANRADDMYKDEKRIFYDLKAKGLIDDEKLAKLGLTEEQYIDLQWAKRIDAWNKTHTGEDKIYIGTPDLQRPPGSTSVPGVGTSNFRIFGQPPIGSPVGMGEGGGVQQQPQLQQPQPQPTQPSASYTQPQQPNETFGGIPASQVVVKNDGSAWKKEFVPTKKWLDKYGNKTGKGVRVEWKNQNHQELVKQGYAKEIETEIPGHEAYDTLVSRIPKSIEYPRTIEKANPNNEKDLATALGLKYVVVEKHGNQLIPLLPTKKLVDIYKEKYKGVPARFRAADGVIYQLETK